MEERKDKGPPQAISLQCETLDALLSPVGNSGRVSYTCMDVSPNYIVFGANTGSLYLFDRKTRRFLRPISTVTEHIVLVKWHSNENLLAVATTAGEIVILETNLADRYIPASVKIKILIKLFAQQKT